MEINKNKNVTLNENNYIRYHTKEDNVNEFTIEAPMINLLPQDKLKNNHMVNNMNGSYTEYANNLIHFDFTKYIPYTSSKTIYYIKNIQNIADITPGTYTLSYALSNIKGSQSLLNIPCYKTSRILNNNVSDVVNIGIMNVKEGADGIYDLTFDIAENEILSELRLGCDFWTWVNGTRELSFDFVFLGLTKGDKPLTRTQDVFSEDPKIFVGNNNITLGNYQISNNLKRHLAQLERHIMAQDGVLDLKLRSN